MRTRQHETTEMLEKTNSKTPVGPTKDRASSTNQHYPNINLRWNHDRIWGLAAGVQLKREAKLLIVIGLTTMHAVVV